MMEKPKSLRLNAPHISAACLAAAFLAAAVSCGKAAVESPAAAREIEAVSVRSREIQDETGGFGALSCLATYEVSSPQDGAVGSLRFREGDSVRRGDILFTLDNPQIVLAAGRAANAYAQAEASVNVAKSRLIEGELQAEAEILSIAKAEAELAQARRVLDEDTRKYGDAETLHRAGGLSDEAIRERRFSLDSSGEQILLMERELEIRRIGFRDRDLDAAGSGAAGMDADERTRSLIFLRTAGLRAELQAAQAYLQGAAGELESARFAESELAVKSPGTGIVGARYVETGERVGRGDRIFTLMDTSSLYAIFSVQESEALTLKQGMPALVSVDGTGGNYKGTVDLVYPQADSQSLSFMVRVLLKESEGLNPGMFARIRITRGPPRKAAVIPDSSILRRRGNENEGTVFVIKGNHLSERRVVLGPARGEEREILSGLAEGEIVAAKPETGMREGDYVRTAK